MSDSSSCNHFNFNDPSKEVITNGVRTETNLHNQRHRSSTVDGNVKQSNSFFETGNHELNKQSFITVERWMSSDAKNKGKFPHSNDLNLQEKSKP